MEGDKLFQYVGHCAQGCVYGMVHVYILAESLNDANLIKEKGGGICGDCMCRNIMDTHGLVITDPEAMVS